MRPVDIDAVATAGLRVTETDLASQLGEFPEVFATSRMVALMEVAAARVLQLHLDGDELSVGVAVDVVHIAATPIGGNVTAIAKFTGQEGKLYVFDVIASDDAGEVGHGTHKRAVVSNARLIAGAAKRKS